MTCPDCEPLARRVAELEALVQKLEARIAQLERKKPRREPPAFVKEDTMPVEPKPSGRPEGHEGVGRETPEEIHREEKIAAVATCPDCGSPVRQKRVRRRTITRLVPGKLENVRYEIPQGYCKQCHKPVEPIVPNALPNTPFDLTLLIWIACLRMLGVSVDKVRFLLKTDYGLRLSSATVTNNVAKLAEFLGEDYEQLRKELLKQRQVHGDETGWRVRGKNWWLWEFISQKQAYFTIRHTRSHTVPASIMTGYDGVFTSDFWNAYNCLKCEKQRCWVHLKRELDKVLKHRRDYEFATFASQLMRLYYWAKSERNHGAKTRAFAEERLQAIISKGYENKDCKRLVKTLTRYQNELFTFCAHRGVKSGNNDAERGIRPAVVIRKTSFGSQSERGAKSTAVMMSFFQTARLQDQNFIEYVQELANNRLQT